MNNKTRLINFYQSRRLIAAIFITAVLLGLMGYIVYGHIPVEGDALLHQKLGLEVSSGSWLTSDTFGYVETPGYPFILGGIYGIFGTNDNAVKLVQVFVYALAAVLVFALGNLLFGRFVGLISAIWYITYYDFISSAYQIMREIWIVLFILLFLLLAARYIKKRELVDLIFCSIMFGFLVMLDPRYCFFLVFLLAFVFFIESECHLKARNVVVVIACIGFFLAPWMVRQSFIYNRVIVFSPLRDNQMRFFISSDSAAKAEGDIASINMSRDDYLHDLRTTGLPLSMQTDIQRQLTDEYIGKMQQKIPNTVLSIFLHRALEYWRFARFSTGVRTGNDMRFEFPWSFSKNLNNILHIGLLLPFFVISSCLICRNRQLPHIFLMAFFVYHMLFHIVVHYLYRYRYPVLPLVFLIGWYGVYHVRNKLRQGHDIQE